MIMAKRKQNEITLKNLNNVKVNIVRKHSPVKSQYISENDREMDKRAKAAVSSAISKAKVCGKPVARYDVKTGRAYIEYADGTSEYVN